MKLGWFAVLGVLSLLGACGGGDDDDDGASGNQGATFGCMFDIGLFRYCGEYRGLSPDTCQQSGGTYYDHCPDGWVGKCSIDANVNPKDTYFYGDAVTESAVMSVCPGGKYTLGTGVPSGAGGTGGSGGSGGTAGKGGAGGTGGSSGTGGTSSAGSSGTGGTAGEVCNDLTTTAPAIDEERGDLADVPEMSGGSIEAGTYYLTRFVVYTSVSLPAPRSRKGTLVVAPDTASDGTMEAVDSILLNTSYSDYTSSFSYAGSDPELTLVGTCGSDLTFPGTYAASGDTLTLLLAQPNSADAIVLWEYEKQ